MGGKYKIYGIVAGSVIGIIVGILYSLMINLFIGILLGIFVGTIIGFFTVIIIKREERSRITNSNTIIMTGSAKHLKNNIKRVVGWLYLTSEELIFKSKFLIRPNYELTIPLDQIIDVQTFKNLGLVPNGLKIIMMDQTYKQFIVTDRKKWLLKLNKIKK